MKAKPTPKKTEEAQVEKPEEAQVEKPEEAPETSTTLSIRLAPDLTTYSSDADASLREALRTLATYASSQKDPELVNDQDVLIDYRIVMVSQQGRVEVENLMVVHGALDAENEVDGQELFEQQVNLMTRPLKTGYMRWLRALL